MTITLILYAVSMVMTAAGVYFLFVGTKSLKRIAAALETMAARDSGSGGS